MKNILTTVVMLLTFSSLSATAAISLKDQIKIQAEEQAAAMKILKQTKADQEKIRAEKLNAKLMAIGNRHSDCDDETEPNGSSSCWDSCSYGPSTCASICGTDSSAGSGGCWDSCTYGPSTCASICGTDTSGGSEGCWDTCTYGPSTCASICGTDTSGGSAGCWEKCTYGPSTCASICGTN